MALYDSADLLAKCKQLSGVPATTEYPTDAAWYIDITTAHLRAVTMVATHAPHHMYEAPTILTSSDSGYTYDFADQPIGSIEIYESLTGRQLREGTFWDPGADYVFEGDRIRIPRGKTKTWSSGPYARYAKAPVAVAAATEPTLMPTYARALIVPETVGLWAARGGMRDPRPFFAMTQQLWYGNPATGDLGILGLLKGETAFGGTQAYSAGMDLSDLTNISTGAGYSGL